MRLKRIILIIVGLVVVLPIVLILVVVARFNPNRYKPEIIAAIEHATHRPVSINGPLRMAVSLTPTITASGLTIANPAGFADPTLLSLPHLQARIALLPLLHGAVDIVSLQLVDPVLTIERNDAGTGDWVFAQPASHAARKGALAARPSASTNGATSHRPISLQ